MNPARLAPQPQIKAAKHRGISTANYANHAKENAAERGWAGLTAGNGERDRTSFLVTPSVLMQAIPGQENQDLWGCSTDFSTQRRSGAKNLSANHTKGTT